MSVLEESSAGPDVKQILAEVGNLPTIPAVALEVIDAAEDPDSSIAQIAGILGRDPALAAKILRVSNSSLYAIGKEVTSIDRAVMVLGTKTVKLLSLSFALVDRLDETFPRGIAPSTFWRRSLTLSVAAQQLADHVWRVAKDEAFLAGLLGYVGKIVLARAMPSHYDELSTFENAYWPTIASEHATLGLDSSYATEAVLREWNLPPVIAGAVGSMFGPDNPTLDEDTCRLATIMHGAMLAETFIVGPGRSEDLAALETFASTAFGMDRESLDAYLLALEEPMEQLAALLEMDDIRLESHEELLARAREAMANVTVHAAEELMQERGRVQHLEQQVDQLDELARRDPLTSLPNRRAIEEFCETQIAARNRHDLDGVFAIVMLDIDHFKQVNDTYGHQIGDHVLQAIGQVMANACRRDEMVGRVGGEEFVVIAPMANAENLVLAGDRLRQTIEQTAFQTELGTLTVTVSIGIAWAQHVPTDDELQKLFVRADTAMYEAKRQGRNRVFVSGMEPTGDVT